MDDKLFYFGAPLTDLEILKSMDKQKLEAAGINVEELEKSLHADLVKAAKNAGLVAQQKQITRGGKQVMTTVWVKPPSSYEGVKPGDKVKFKDGRGKEHEGEVEGRTSRLQHLVNVDGKQKKINHDQVTHHSSKDGEKKEKETSSKKKPTAARGGIRHQEYASKNSAH